MGKCGDCEEYYNDDPTLKEEPEFCKLWKKSKKPSDSCSNFKEWFWTIQTTLTEFQDHCVINATSERS